MLNNPDNSFVALGFIHRMPWMMYILQESNENEGLITFGVNIEYTG